MSELLYNPEPDAFEKHRPVYGIRSKTSKLTQSDYKMVDVRPPTSSTNSKVVFKKLADQWKRDTAHLSIVSQRLRHPAYSCIMQMGISAIPLILEELERQPDHWFYALTQLTQENPIPVDFDGTVADAADLWISWGRNRIPASSDDTMAAAAGLLISLGSNMYAS